MKAVLLTATLALSIALGTSCKKDKTDSNTYNLTVENNSGETKIVTLEETETEELIDSVSLSDGETHTINDLEKGVSYMLEAKKEGQKYGGYFESWYSNKVEDKTITLE